MALSTNLGYPRIGKNREFKKTIETFWKGNLSADQFTQELGKIHELALRTQVNAGLDYIPVCDFSAYDLMLETAIMLGVIPKRFQHLKGWERYYAMARGTQEVTACEMKKWFDTNYHYIVPEIEGEFGLTKNLLLEFYGWAKTKFKGKNFRPVVIGPFTFLKLSTVKNGKSFSENLAALTNVYQKIIAEMTQTNCEWIQIDEPALCGDVTEKEWKAFEATYQALSTEKKKLKLMLQTYYGDVASLYSKIKKLPVDGIGLDLVRGRKNKEVLQKEGVPEGKWLGLGIVDGRNIWRTNLEATLEELETLTTKFDRSKLWIHPSCSLLHLPISLENETQIPNVLKKRLGFAEDRLKEVLLLTTGFNKGKKAVQEGFQQNGNAFKDKEFTIFALDPSVQKRIALLKEDDFQRKSPFEKRLALQQKHLNLPPLPTTTIGSFPQTAEIRQARAKWRKGEWSQAQYDQFLREEIGRVVRLQEEIGLDVLVHGEPERTDMVEYFGEQMRGFQFTQNGWVQSYGTRCVRPPMIYGDVSREGPMTVEESKYAKSLTKKPMKGMLTGPVTILNWSFPRVDVSKETQAMQIALALRDEVLDLEKNDVLVIQIDEPALREGLPLRQQDWGGYLKWAVDAFRLTASGVKDTTQIHTHMCYSKFSDILESIQALDADVLSIEDSRSHGRLAKELSEMHYRQGMGPGIYDVHSERVPPQEEFEKIIRFLVKHVPLKTLWINPDCGLKTRGYKETTPSLKNMVEAVKKVRATLN